MGDAMMPERIWAEPPMTQITDDQREAIGAIHKAAFRRGYRQGFDVGIGEKAWLHRHWPAIALLIGGVMLIIGFFLGLGI